MAYPRHTKHSWVISWWWFECEVDRLRSPSTLPQAWPDFSGYEANW